MKFPRFATQILSTRFFRRLWLFRHSQKMQSREHSRFFRIRFKARCSGGFQPITAP